jgi:hypothetical protein
LDVGNFLAATIWVFKVGSKGLASVKSLRKSYVQGFEEVLEGYGLGDEEENRDETGSCSKLCE